MVGGWDGQRVKRFYEFARGGLLLGLLVTLTRLLPIQKSCRVKDSGLTSHGQL